MTKAERNRAIAKQVDEILQKHFEGERCGFVIAFTEPPHYLEASYVSNVKRKDGLDILQSGAGQLRARQN